MTWSLLMKNLRQMELYEPEPWKWKSLRKKMGMAETLRQMVPFICFFSLLFFFNLTHSSAPSALPNCPDTCNNVAIPYPFGVGNGCYLEPSFEVTCPKPDTAAVTPLPLLGKEGNISKISTNGFLLVQTFIARDCYDAVSDSPTTHSWATTFARSPNFPFSPTRNRFTAVGCDTAAFLWNTASSSLSGCITVCQNDSSVQDGECNGVGCCQTSNITDNLRSINVSLTSFYNLSKVMSFDPCSYAFFVDKEHYSFLKSDFKSLRSKPYVLMALDWAVGHAKCSQAQSTAAYACKANTYCYDPDNASGYRCNCGWCLPEEEDKHNNVNAERITDSS